MVCVSSTYHFLLSTFSRSEAQRVAQFGSARASGARGRRFESFHADWISRAGGRMAMQRAVTPPSYRTPGGSIPSLPIAAKSRNRTVEQ